MPAKAPKTPYWRNLTLDSVSLLARLAQTPGRNDILMSSQPGSKAAAFKFRQRLYAWRRSVLDALVPPESDEARGTAAWLEHTFGPRVTKDWLDLTTFAVVAQPEGWHVTARLREVMDGPDIRFADGRRADLADAAQLIREAQARRASRGPEAVLPATGEPE